MIFFLQLVVASFDLQHHATVTVFIENPPSSFSFSLIPLNWNQISILQGEYKERERDSKAMGLFALTVVSNEFILIGTLKALVVFNSLAG